MKSLMTTPGECIAPDEPLQRAASRMRDLNIGMLAICAHDRLVGVVTDRDITVRAVAAGLDPRTTPVREAMTPQVFYCFDEETIDEAARWMEQKAVRRLLVLDRNLRLVGVLSMDDIARQRGEHGLVAEIAHSATDPSAPPG